MYARSLDIRGLSAKKSLFLFGPRSTGKTTLLRDQFGSDAIVNLLTSATYLPLAANPSRIADLSREILRTSPVVVIDEIQKLPALLDEVHHLIESEQIRFVLTGSSVRRLKCSGVNLLAGRAWQCDLFPLTSREIDDFDLERYLKFGGLPQVYTSKYPEEELDAYVSTYLREEIQEEALVQNLTAFSRFLKAAGLSNSEQVNYASIASDSGISASSVRSYFGILADTFTGFLLPSWRESKKRKAVATPKFYLFDVGIANFLRGSNDIREGSAEFGKAFEQFIAMELRSRISYRRDRTELCYWRTPTGAEVDFLIGDEIAIEVKASRAVSDKHLKGLRALKEEGVFRRFYLVSLDPENRETPDGVRILHWSRFLSLLWGDGTEQL